MITYEKITSQVTRRIRKRKRREGNRKKKGTKKKKGGEKIK